ncbi:MAG: periplasmic heavy metal sensor [Pseudodesulfovibrio sp.]|nr:MULTISPECIES: periplasmic heavy metal sensor [Pseudodesulfovibrio]MBU4192004.1 periplasmic heavy metal sensor [Pseudomonadota bacterium]MBU4243108.1 periplasmic heavy metal sensor [Pseudomonadota bacterium]MBU4377479.1 periplasmic heavy metal sensor [Pseudomonadota bacterium]MBU4474622.1 periplasmic heavy metal sensor [Pseudomonadota bacterium]MBU4516925.1 periplasmic heavy metal sensor [Pseudomonadota bacterium]
MRRSLLVLSLCLNIAFVAFWAVRAMPDMFDPPPVLRGTGHGLVAVALFDELDATPEQREQLAAFAARFSEEAGATRRVVRMERERLLDLLAAENLDKAAIQAAQQRILDGQARMKDAVVDLLIEARAMLSREQYQILIASIRARSERPGAGMPGRGGLGSGMERE